MEKHEQRIKEIIRESIADAGRQDLFREPLFAVSSAQDPRYQELKTIIGDWHSNPEELLSDARSVLSVFVPFTQLVVESVKIQEPVSRIWAESYVVVNNLFDQIGQAVVEYLEQQGYTARSIAATHTYDPVTLRSIWSHRSAAAIAGLGSFGVNRMLFTEKGSAGRYCSILTSALLKVSTKPAPEYCLYHIDGSCLACLKVCPVDALTVDSLDKFTCNANLLTNADRLKDIGFSDVCGKCVAYCPVAYME